MRKPNPSYHHRAFSLLEILIAMGVFAIAISGLLALFPVALHTEKESEQETRSTLIASGVMDALAASVGHGSLCVATGMSNNLPLWESIAPDKMTNLCVAYNLSCEPLCKLTNNEAALPLTNRAAASIITLSILSKPSVPGLLTAELVIASPASAPVTGRTLHRFVRLIPMPPS